MGQSDPAQGADAAEPGIPLGRRVARLFQEMADLVELEGSDPRRAVAYRRAALVLRDAAEPVERLVAEGRLTALPGIGPVLAAKIEECARSGTMAALEGLRAQVPPGVAALLDVRGVGPKLAAAAWRQLGVESPAALRDAAADGRLASLPGVGAARARRVLEAADAALSPLRLLGAALPVGEALAAALAADPAVGRAAVAGAVRRGCPLVLGLDLVAQGSPDAVVRVLAGVADWAEVPARDGPGAADGAPAEAGTTDGSEAGPAGEGQAGRRDAGEPPVPALGPRVRGTLASGLPVRVVVVPPDAFGTALLWMTGSAEHLRDLAQRREAPQAPALPLAAEEAAVYAALGLGWIPPELREGRGEVAAAAAGALPERLVEVGDLRGDLHCHTTYSDGTATPEAMAAAAAARGYAYLALADHSRSLVVAHGMSVDSLRERGRRIADYNAAHPGGPPLLHAAEVEVLRDGALDFPDDVLAELDFVVAAMHNGYGQSGAELTARSIRALEHPAVDLLAHPTGRRLGRREAFPVDVAALVAAAARHGKAVEVNGSPERLDLDASYARTLPEAGVPASLDSDAHSVDGLAAARYAVITARRAGLRPSDAINTRPLQALLARRGGRRP